MPEETLDPQDWDALRALGHQMLDDAFAYMQNLRDSPVWQPMPPELKARFTEPLPQTPRPPVDIYRRYQEEIVPYNMGNPHPRFWGWVMGNGTPLGMLADMLASTINPNMGGADHAAVYVERQVIDWMKELMGFPPEASGLLVSGGSMANLVGITVARNTLAGYDIRTQGLHAGPRQMVLYGSVEMHSSMQKAVELLGLGSEALRKIPVNGEYQIDLNALHQAIREDKAAGLQPFCVIGNAGTVNTGAIDDLRALAEIAHSENLWFHVDGAFGALARTSPKLQPLVAGMEQADSLAFDLHKWMYMPFEIGCVLVRSEEAHRRAFSLTPEYLSHAEHGLNAGSIWFSDYGVQLTRGFRALKAWMSIQEHGIQKYGRIIRQNVEQAQYLADLVKRTPPLEMMAPVPLNIVCFRYVVKGYSQEQLNEFNKELLARLHESGVAVPTYTTLDGCYSLRAAITNHRSRLDDFDVMIDEVVKIGKEMEEEGVAKQL